MIDLSTSVGRRYRVGIASVLRRCAAGGVMLACLLSSSAQAGGLAWDRFIETCFAPMYEFQPAKVAQLAKLQAPEWADVSNEADTYAGPRRHIFVVTGANGEEPRCQIIAAPDAGSDLTARFEIWVKAAQAQDIFEVVEDEGPHYYESLIHEPRIAVTFRPATQTQGAMIEVRQTLKES